MAWYDPIPTLESKRDYSARFKYNELVFKRAKSFKEIVGELEDGVQYRIITELNFNALSVIQYLTELYELSEVVIAVYRMNRPAVLKLMEFADNEKMECTILLSSFFRENKKYERWCEELISHASARHNVTVAFAWSHAKVFLGRTKCGKHIVFEGSGNLSDNARIEQYIIESNESAYNFHKKWIMDYVEKSK